MTDFDERLLDKTWRMDNLYSIVDKSGKRIPFKMNRAQRHFHENRSGRDQILKSRQLGFSTYFCVDSLDEALFNKNYSCLQIAHTKDASQNLFDRKIVFAWRNIPPEVRELWQVSNDNAQELSFDFGDGSISRVQVATSGRSGTYQNVHISELAKIGLTFPQRAAEIITGTLPAVPATGKVSIESTSEGPVGVFYDMWYKNDTFTNHFYNWQWDDYELGTVRTAIPVSEMDSSQDFAKIQAEHDLTDLEITFYYRKWRELNKDWTSLKHEYPITVDDAFTGATTLFFNQRSVAELNIEDHYPLYDGKRYGQATNYGKYVMGVDVSEGVEKDHSSIVVWDFSHLTESGAFMPKVVFTFKSNTISPERLAFRIRDVGYQYGNPMVAVERNNHGHATLQKLKDIYPVSRIWKKDPAKITHLGWDTNSATKTHMLNLLKEAVSNEAVIIPCEDLILDLRTFPKERVSQTKRDPEAGHYDILTAAAIAYAVQGSATTKAKYRASPNRARNYTQQKLTTR